MGPSSVARSRDRPSVAGFQVIIGGRRSVLTEVAHRQKSALLG